MSRIIAGIHRGRRLAVPGGKAVRPTTDRMRERVFSILSHHRYPDMVGARVADLFAGTGALGLEALSRGAGHTTFVEKSPNSVTCLHTNIEALNVTDQTDIIQTSARNLPAVDAPYDFIFMDPPYHKGLVEPTLTSLISAGWIAPGGPENGVIICELAKDDPLELPPSLALIDERRQGIQRTVFLSLQSA
jgi:16S rRNA (guanine966-N2)-methyltransferase